MAYRNQYFRIETTAANFGKLYLELEQESAPADDPRRIEYGKAFDEFEKRSSDILTPEDYQEIFGQSPPDPHPPKSDLDVTSGDFVVGAPTLQSFEPREPRIQLDEDADLTGCQIVAIGIEDDDDLTGCQIVAIGIEEDDDLTGCQIVAIGIEEDDDQVETPFASSIPNDGPILRRFPIFVQHLLVRNIALATHSPDLTIDDLDRYTDNELSVVAFAYLPTMIHTNKSDHRRNSYVRILGIALRHFQNDPLAVRASVDLVRMIASGTQDDDE